MSEPERWADRIAAAFPDLAVRGLEVMPHLGWGGDSDALLVNGGLIVRFPRRPEVAEALAVEVCLLPRLRRRVPVAIPDFRRVAAGPAGGPPRGVAYRALPGRPLTAERFAAIGDAATIDRLAVALAGFLSGLHAFPPAEARACGVPTPAAATADLLDRWRARVEAVVFPVLGPAARWRVAAEFEAMLDDARASVRPLVVCHGDLSTDHILALTGADGARLTGIIDFGDLCLGDPSGEFLWRFDYGEAFYHRVLDAYTVPRGDSDAFDRATAFRHRLLPTLQIAHGVETGGADDVAAGRQALLSRLGLTATEWDE